MNSPVTRDFPGTKYHPLRKALLAILLVTTGIIVYSDAFHAGMVFDDNGFIVNDPAIRMTELSWDGIITAALEGRPPHRYLPNISWALNYYFGQYNPFGYHLVNLAIHLLTGLFLFAFIKNTLRASIKEIISSNLNRRGGVYPRPKQENITPSPAMNKTMIEAYGYKINPDIIAFLAALIWIVQPVGTQAVTYICQRMASMVALFYILSLLFYAKGRMAMQPSSANPLKIGLYFSGCFLAALCALATKENAGTLPIMILLYEWIFFQNFKVTGSGRQILCILFLGLVFVGAAFWFTNGDPFDYLMRGYTTRNFDLTQRVMTQWRIMIYYISLFWWAPAGRLNLDHDYPLSLSPVDPSTTIIALAAILSLFALAAHTAKKDRLITFCILWFFITQATESTIVGIELIFEHRTYIPFMMASLFFVLLAFRAIRHRTAACALLLGTVLLFSAWTYQRNQIWQNPVAFWSDALAKSKNKSRAAKNLAFEYLQKEEWEAATVYFKKALHMNDESDPLEFSTYANLATALVKQDRFFDATFYYYKAMQFRDDEMIILRPLAFSLLKTGELEAAHYFYRLALDLSPKDESLKKESDALFKFLGQYTDPEDRIRQLLADSPSNPALMLKQGDLLAIRGMEEKAINAYQKALSITDSHDEILNHTLLSRLAKTFFSTHRFNDALSTYRKLIIMNPENAMLYYNTAAVYAILGNISKTKAFLEKAGDRGLNVDERIKTDPNFEKMREWKLEIRKDQR